MKICRVRIERYTYIRICRESLNGQDKNLTPAILFIKNEIRSDPSLSRIPDKKIAILFPRDGGDS